MTYTWANPSPMSAPPPAANRWATLIGPGQDANSFDPGRLEFGQTYYWRVDEVGAAPGFTVFQGRHLVLHGRAVLVSGRRRHGHGIQLQHRHGPGKTIDGSGLNADQHSNDPSHMWLSRQGHNSARAGFSTPSPASRSSIRCSSGTTIRPWSPSIGFGAKDVTVEYSARRHNLDHPGQLRIRPERQARPSTRPIPPWISAASRFSSSS